MRSPLIVKALGAVLIVVFAVIAATGPSGAAGGYGGGGTAPTLSLKVAKQKLRTVRKKGLKVKATCNVACSVVVVPYRGTKAIGYGQKRLPAKTGTVKVTFKKKAPRKFTVKGVAVNDSNVRSAIVSKSVKLKRKR